MGCLVSFLNSMRGYHGSHLSPRQLERQRRQRSSNKNPPRKPPQPTPPSSPEDEGRHQSLSSIGRIPSATSRHSGDSSGSFSKH